MSAVFEYEQYNTSSIRPAEDNFKYLNAKLWCPSDQNAYPIHILLHTSIYREWNCQMCDQLIDFFSKLCEHAQWLKCKCFKNHDHFQTGVYLNIFPICFSSAPWTFIKGEPELCSHLFANPNLLT